MKKSLSAIVVLSVVYLAAFQPTQAAPSQTTENASATLKASYGQFVQAKVKTATPVQSISARPKQLTPAEAKAYSARPASIGDTLKAVGNLIRICKGQSSWKAQHECYLYFDSKGLHQLPVPTLKSVAAIRNYSGNPSPAPIASLTPDPNDQSNQEDYQAEINNAQALVHQLQSPSPSPASCGTPKVPTGFCEALASPKPSNVSLTQQVDFPIPISFFKMSGGQFDIKASITPPILSFADMPEPATELASADATLSFTPPGNLVTLIPSLLKPNGGGNAAPAPTPSAISLAEATVTVTRPTASASPEPSPTPYVDAKATFFGDQTVFDQSMGFNDVLPLRLQSQATSTNLCPGTNNQPLFVAFNLGVPGVNLILTVTCPLVAGYQLNDAWLSNEVSVLGAPKFSVGVVGDADITGVVGSLLSGGGEADLNIANGEMRTLAFADAINDTTYGSSQHALITGGYIFGHYEVGGGDLFATVTFSGYTVYLRLLHVDSASVKNFGEGAFTVYSM